MQMNPMPTALMNALTQSSMVSRNNPNTDSYGYMNGNPVRRVEEGGTLNFTDLATCTCQLVQQLPVEYGSDCASICGPRPLGDRRFRILCSREARRSSARDAVPYTRTKPNVMKQWHDALCNNNSTLALEKIRLGNIEVNANCVRNQMKPLHLACFKASEDVIQAQALIKARANVHSEDDTGRTPFDIAAESGLYKICNQLIAADPDVAKYAVKKHGHTDQIQKILDISLLEAAEGNGDASIKQLRVLLELGASQRQRSIFGDGPIGTAVSNYNLLAVKLMLKKGFEVDDLVEEGSTPLISALLRNDLEMALYLIKNGANVNHINSKENGETPLHFTVRFFSRSAEYRLFGIIKALLQAGARTDIKDAWGMTPVDLAERGNKLHIRDLLITPLEINDEEADNTGCFKTVRGCAARVLRHSVGSQSHFTDNMNRAGIPTGLVDQMKKLSVTVPADLVVEMKKLSFTGRTINVSSQGKYGGYCARPLSLYRDNNPDKISGIL